MQTAADMPMEMTKNENEEPVKLPKSSTIIAPNGLKITSKLNPDAKEFYPAYVMRQKIIRGIGDAGACVTSTQPSLHFAQNANVANVLKVIKVDGQAANQMETDVDTLKDVLETRKTTGCGGSDVERLKSSRVSKLLMGVEESGNAKVSRNTQSVNIGSEKPAGRLSKDTEKPIEEDVRTSEEDSNDFEHFEDAEGEPMQQLACDEATKIQLKPIKCMESAVLNSEDVVFIAEHTFSDSDSHQKTHQANVSDDEIHERYSDRGSNETLNEFKCKEDTESVEVSELSEENELAEEEALHEVPALLEDIKEASNSCGNGDSDVANLAETVCECVRVGDGDMSDHIVNVGACKLTADDGINLETGESNAPPNTPTEVSAKSTTGKTTRSGKAKSTKDKEDKKKSEKRITLRKLASISLSLRGKNSSAHHAEKTTPRSSSSSAMTRTKRLSESLHNLTSGLKSKVDSRKAEGGSRFLPRSGTNIPRPPVTRKRNLLTRATTETNGMNYKAPKVRTAHNNNNKTASGTVTNTTTTTHLFKDDTSLKSASSSEQNLANKSNTQSPKKLLLNSKSTNVAVEKSGIPTVVATKSKDLVGKARPRGTHASTLRQSEAQKRRSLFPNEDATSNIELSQFLFK